MIMKQKAIAFVQQCEPKRKYDSLAKKFTDEVEVNEAGFTRYTLTLAVPGEREPLRVSTDEFSLSSTVGLDPVGKIVEISYTARVEMRWAVADEISEVSAGA